MTFKRALGPFDATMVVIGGIIGSGIFINPYIVAQRLDSPGLVLAAWAAGGAIALAGAFAYAELGAIFPRAGGQYVYLRDAYHPLAGFLYGWALLALIESGAIAAVAITFANYALRLTGRPDLAPAPLAIAAVVLLSLVNYLGVKPGSRVLNVLVVLKVAALAVLIGVRRLCSRAPGLVDGRTRDLGPAADDSGRVRRRARADPLCLRRLAERELRRRGDREPAPQSAAEPDRRHERRRRHLRPGQHRLPARAGARRAGRDDHPRVGRGASGCSARSAIGSSPRRSRSRRSGFSTSRSSRRRASTTRWRPTACSFPRSRTLHPTYRTPGLAIVLQSAWSCVLALTGTYGQLLNYVVFADWIFFGLTVATVLVFRRTFPLERRPPGSFRAPGYPVVQIAFSAVAAAVVLSVVWADPAGALRGTLLLAAGIPVYYWFSRRTR